MKNYTFESQFTKSHLLDVGDIVRCVDISGELKFRPILKRIEIDNGMIFCFADSDSILDQLHLHKNLDVEVLFL